VSAVRALLPAEVLRVRDLPAASLPSLLNRFRLRSALVAVHQLIPGSYWGECEAGLIGTTVFFRDDTPLHSVLHEAAHCVCMTSERRAELIQDAGGDYDEENAVCYLQMLLGEELPGVGRVRMAQDMDTWGYTFRLGSAQAWFEQDAEAARLWLIEHQLIDATGRISWSLRE
jgi:hypothetical protein